MDPLSPKFRFRSSDLRIRGFHGFPHYPPLYYPPRLPLNITLIRHNNPAKTPRQQLAVYPSLHVLAQIHHAVAV